jgi:hypothetical protein
MTTDRRSLVLPNKKQKINSNRIRLATIMMVLPFFLGSDLFCLITVGVEGYCCTWSFSVAHTSHSVGLLWTRDRLVAETSTWQHTTFTWDRKPRLRWDSNPQSQQARDARPTGSASLLSCNYIFMVFTRLSLILRRCVSLMCSVELTSRT